MSQTGQTPSPSSSATPLMRQYGAIKAEHPGSVLLFHLGDFYEMFGEDARTASRVLGITLTSRSKGDGSIPLAGIPVHAARDYIEKLLKAGHSVAICEQVEDASAAKGLVKREVTRVITPGTLLDEGLLQAGRNNYLAAVACSSGRGRCGLAYLDLSTGEFSVAELDRDRLAEELERIRPSELLAPEMFVRDEEAPGYGQDSERIESKAYPDWAFDVETARRKLLEHFKTESLEAFGCEDMTLATSAAGALMRYLEETHRSGLDHVDCIEVVDSSDFVAFDGEALRNLEVLETIRDRRAEGSLLGVMDRTRTGPGARRLRQWLVRPLATLEAIHARQDAVGELVAEHAVRAGVRARLAEMQDIERLASKLASGRVNARDLVAIAASVEELPRLASALDGAASGLLKALAIDLGGHASLAAIAEDIRRTLDPEPPVSVRDGGIIADGVNDDLDRLRGIRAGGKTWIAEFQAREARRTGISSLKVGYNRVFGYFIEVTRANLAGVPDDYERKQTLANAERYVTPELKAREAEVLGAEERIVALELELFTALRDRAAAHVKDLARAGSLAGDLDALASLAEIASERGYVRPVVDDSLVLKIEDGRHPVLDAAMDANRYVPNDVDLDGASRQVLVVTGPNMAGKSTYIRQVALLAAMAQVGSFVPARSARVGLVDRIYARVGASDDLSRGRSTFMVEMVETARVLRTATERSLVVLDEVGRGTSTYDGVSIAWAVTEHLHDRVGARTLFATHYHELCALSEELPRVANVNVAVREWGSEIAFLYRIVPGGADKSYGIHVAKIAGVPDEVIGRAREILSGLESRAEEPVERARKRRRGPRVEQLGLFAPAAASAVEEELRALDIDKLTPVDALLKLAELKRSAARDGGRR